MAGHQQVNLEGVVLEQRVAESRLPVDVDAVENFSIFVILRNEQQRS